MNTLKMTLGIVLGSAAAFAAGCGSSSSSSSSAAVTYTQVDRLARPAINEGLFVTDSFLNTVNQITPAQESAALVGAVATEAIASLDAFDSADGANNVTATDVVLALIPDVMRIDTGIASPTSTAGGHMRTGPRRSAPRSARSLVARSRTM
jgi:hypothetical protein